MGAHESKTFKSGNSVALRLPKALGVGPDERMLIERDGEVLTVRPVRDAAEEQRKLRELAGTLRRLGPVPDTGPEERLEFPERTGL
jgi:antitoxin VapB